MRAEAPPAAARLAATAALALRFREVDAVARTNEHALAPVDGNLVVRAALAEDVAGENGGDTDEAAGAISVETVLAALGCAHGAEETVARGLVFENIEAMDLDGTQGITPAVIGAELHSNYHIEITPGVDLSGSAGWSLSVWFSLARTQCEIENRTLVLLGTKHEDDGYAIVKFEGGSDGVRIGHEDELLPQETYNLADLEESDHAWHHLVVRGCPLPTHPQFPLLH